MNIVDTVQFFDEVDLLRARMSEHYEHVSKIFVIEAELTHSYKPRTQTFLDHRSKFVEWQDKIEHIVVPASAFVDAAFPAPQKRARDNEFTQIFWPFTHGMAPEAEWWLACGADETIRSEEWDGLKYWLAGLPKDSPETRTVRLNFDFYNYGINLQLPYTWNAKRMRHKNSSFKKWDAAVGIDYPPTIGWHFSYMGGPEVILKKMEALIHFREDHVARVIGKPERIQEALDGQYCMYGGYRLIEWVTDNHLPQYMLDHWEDYEKFWWYGRNDEGE